MLLREFRELLVVEQKVVVALHADKVERQPSFAIQAAEILWRIDAIALQVFHERLELREQFQQLKQRFVFERSLALQVRERIPLRSKVEQQRREMVVRFDILLAFAPLDFVERRLRDIDVPVLNELQHLPIKERQEQGTNMSTVNVCVCHDDYSMVS